MYIYIYIINTLVHVVVGHGRKHVQLVLLPDMSGRCSGGIFAFTRTSVTRIWAPMASNNPRHNSEGVLKMESFFMFNLHISISFNFIDVLSSLNPHTFPFIWSPAQFPGHSKTASIEPSPDSKLSASELLEAVANATNFHWLYHWGIPWYTPNFQVTMVYGCYWTSLKFPTGFWKRLENP